MNTLATPRQVEAVFPMDSFAYRVQMRVIRQWHSMTDSLAYRVQMRVQGSGTECGTMSAHYLSHNGGWRRAKFTSENTPLLQPPLTPPLPPPQANATHNQLTPHKARCTCS